MFNTHITNTGTAMIAARELMGVMCDGMVVSIADAKITRLDEDTFVVEGKGTFTPAELGDLVLYPRRAVYNAFIDEQNGEEHREEDSGVLLTEE